MGVFCLYDSVGIADRVNYHRVGNVTVEVEFYPMAEALIDGIAYGCVVAAKFLNAFRCRLHVDIVEIVNVDEAEHVARHIEGQDGIIAGGEFAERHFFGNIAKRQAELTEFFDIHGQILCDLSEGKTKPRHPHCTMDTGRIGFLLARN